MTDALNTAFTVSGIAIIVIFLVLTILIFTIKLLVYLLPYEAPPPQVKKAQPASQTSDVDADIAVITSVMAAHLGQTMGNLQVINIQSR